jgi:hypothetical protein
LIDLYNLLILKKCGEYSKDPIPILIFMPKIERMEGNDLNNYLTLYHENMKEIPIIFVFEQVKSNIFSPKVFY